MWFESEGEAQIQVVLSEPVAGEVKVRWETHDGSAVAGEDYLASLGVLTFPPGVASQVISIPLVDDGSGDDGEDFIVVLLAASGAGFRSGVVPQYAIQIVEGDIGFRVRLASDRFFASEGDGEAVVWVEVSQALSEEIVTEFDVLGRSAHPGSDFVESVVTAVIPAGRTQAPVSIQLVDDDTAEPIEHFAVRSRYSEEGPPSIAFVRIEDDDSGKRGVGHHGDPSAGLPGSPWRWATWPT